MNTLRTLSEHNPRKQAKKNSVAYTITVDLGYCCERFFFLRYTDTELVALRLGVTPDTIRRHKKCLREGKICCTRVEGCLDPLHSGELFNKVSV